MRTDVGRLLPFSAANPPDRELLQHPPYTFPMPPLGPRTIGMTDAAVSTCW